ncbi:DUF885 domain-containing protein [Stakelama sp. CBK3Z-3]|uniref:DUF885 domain-containing protein n=1 Tax=Stakelama flava TaxID=2860338 RepID=A0ABS6XQE4_9SPHN|nr:DUF885 domain-containing protein [Stakelama flava]MBW4331621.1 DUF885 domain-containing protein [Stakelama flava]
MIGQFGFSRRTLLGSAVVLTALPGLAASGAVTRDAALVALLDDIARSNDPARGMDALRAFDPKGLSPVRRLDLLTVCAGLATDARMVAQWPWAVPGHSPWPVSPRAGLWRHGGASNVPNAAAQIDTETRSLSIAAQHGVILAHAALEETLAGLEKAAAMAKGDVGRALQRQAAMLAAQRETAPARAGLTHCPSGAKYYTLMLERALGKAIAPEMAHRRAESVSRALVQRADTLFRLIGMADGSTGERFRELARDPRYLYADSDAGRDRAVADMNHRLARVKTWLPTAFADLPPAIDHVAARRMSPADEAAGRGGYRIVPPADGSGEGGYFVDLSHIRQRPSWTLPSVVHHELLPGHMVQMPIEAAADPHPLRLDHAAAFTEGWAVYAERLMLEEGAFEGAPLAELGYIQWALFRVGRALADTGIHHRGWTRAQAVETLRDLQGEGVIFAPLEEDVARIALEPAIRSAEFLMADSLGSMRADAADIRAFHSAVLVPGSLPLTLVEQVTRGII